MKDNKTISILGCGWLGWALAKHLVSLGHQVKGSTTSPKKINLLRADNIDAFQIDLANDILDQHLDFFKTDVLILNIPPGRKDPNFLQGYPSRVRRVIDAALSGKVKSILHVSSTGVYQSMAATKPTWDFPIYSDNRPNATGGSSEVLIEAEHIVAASNIEHAILRFGGLVGGDRKAGRFLAGRKNLKNGVAPVNMIHRDDCIQIIYQIIKKSLWGGVWNAVSDGHPSRKVFYQNQAQKNGLEVPTFLDESMAIGKVISNEKLKKELDYTFIHPDPLLY